MTAEDRRTRRLREQGAAKPLAEYERDVLIGGNHLASQMFSLGVKDVALMRLYTYDDVLKDFGQPIADIWVAWRAIMVWCDARERFADVLDTEGDRQEPPQEQ